MRKPLLVLCALVLHAIAASADETTLKSLYDSHQWFELRKAAHNRDTPKFYQGAVACTFNRVNECKKKLVSVIRSSPSSEQAREAHLILISTYLRIGRYREVLPELDQMLEAHPDDLEVKQARKNLATLNLQNQTVSKRSFSQVIARPQGGNLAIAVSINGRPANYIVDTGSLSSVLSESEAQRLGMTILNLGETSASINGLPFRVAVANTLALGNFHLRHVAFLVFPDKEQPFVELPEGERGIIGLPVLLAFRTLSWTSGGTFEIAPKLHQHGPHSDLAFNGSYNGQVPVTEMQFQDTTLTFMLDLGAETTDLYQHFAHHFPRMVSELGSRKLKTLNTIGRTENLDSITIPQIEFRLAGFPVKLGPAHILGPEVGGDSRFSDGNLGMDLLKQSKRVTVDFNAMTLTLE